jgi:hypothetical protein
MIAEVIHNSSCVTELGRLLKKKVKKGKAILVSGRGGP